MTVANENEIAPTGPNVVTLSDAGTRTAATGRGHHRPRSAQTNPDVARGVKTFVDHGRACATQAADGDLAALKRLLRLEGEMFVRAGMQLLAESDDA